MFYFNPFPNQVNIEESNTVDYTEKLQKLLNQPKWKIIIYVVILHAMLVWSNITNGLYMIKTLLSVVASEISTNIQDCRHLIKTIPTTQE